MSAPCAAISLEDADGFCDYFNCADELSAPLTGMEDLAGPAIARARRAASSLGLCWPPRLAEAEEFWLANRACLSDALREMGRIS